MGLREREGNGRYQEVEVLQNMYLKHMPLKIVGFVGSGFAHRGVL